MSANHSSKCSELTEEHHKIIGKIVVEWANIEFLLRSLLTRLLLTPAFLGRSYTDRMNAVKLQEAIKEAVDIHKTRYRYRVISKTVLDEINHLNDKINGLRAMRNKFVHFCWSRNTDEKIFGTNYSGGTVDSKKHKKSFIVYSVSELEEIYNEAYKIVDHLHSITYSLPELDEDGLHSKLTWPD